MDWKDIGSKIIKDLPSMGSALLGAPGAAAGQAIKLIAQALGVQETPDAVDAAISANPDALLKLKDLEFKHAEELKRLENQESQMYFQDTVDARGREKTYLEKIGRPDYNLYILAWVLVIGFFVLMGILLIQPLEKDATGVIFMLFGALASAFGQVVGYFFGSSASSARKDTVLAQTFTKGTATS